jgi:hypothetical protein
VLAFYAERALFRPLGLASELDDAALATRIAAGRVELSAPAPPIPGLGDGAARLAARLLEPTVRVVPA